MQSNLHINHARLIYKNYQLIHHQLVIKRGDTTGYDGFKKILGTKIHVAVESNGLPVSIRTSPANIHDSTKFIDVMESISDFVDDSMMDEIVSCFADKGYDANTIRDYLRNNGINCCIIYKSNSKLMLKNNLQNNSYKHYNKTRFVVERFFAWFKCGFHRTAIRYERDVTTILGLFTWHQS